MPASLTDNHPGEGIVPPARPARPHHWTYRNQNSTFEKLRKDKLHCPLARGRLFHAFANHELLAIELMALCLLRFPQAPSTFRQGLVKIIAEEQAHFQLYRQRMNALGIDFGELPVSDFFWRTLSQVRTIEEFVVGMSLTIEQANLDYCLYFHQIFLGHGDTQSAALLKRVYLDEIGHVGHGAYWIQKWHPEETLWQIHERNLPSGSSLVRAKGIGFDKEGRHRAGLDNTYINKLEIYAHPIAKTPKLLLFNSDCEIEIESGPSYQRKESNQKRIDEMANIMQYLPETTYGDIIITRQAPSHQFLVEMKDLGFPLCQFADPSGWQEKNPAVCSYPWGWTPSVPNPQNQPMLPEKSLFSKAHLPQLRTDLRHHLAPFTDFLLPSWADGYQFDSIDAIKTYSRHIYTKYGLSIVVKAPYSAAGRSRIFLTDGSVKNFNHMKWLALRLSKDGVLIGEPWFKQKIDLSFIMRRNKKNHLTSFFTNSFGQYQGHVLGQPSTFWPEDLKKRFYRQANGLSPQKMYQQVTIYLTHWLKKFSYQGPFGIDILATKRHGQWYFHPLIEYNPRLTMGHVAIGLSQVKAPNSSGIWIMIRSTISDTLGFPSLNVLARHIKSQFPIVKSKSGKIISGIFFTNDPQQAVYQLGVVGIGPSPSHYLKETFMKIN